MNEKQQILVGVDGSEGGRAAIRYAAEQAKRGDMDLRVVHVIPGLPTFTSIYSMPYAEATREERRVGRQIIAEAKRDAVAAVGDERVQASLLEGATATALVHAAKNAKLVVLGDQPRPMLGRVVTGSVIAKVAAHSPVPVVAVPGTWQPGEGVGRVLVGVKDVVDSVELISRALDVAAEREGSLTIFHVWSIPMPYEDFSIKLSDGEAEIHGDLEKLLERVRRQVGEAAAAVKVNIEVVRGQAAHAIASASADADLLVIGRRRHFLPGGYLGSTGRALLRSDQCPVEVLPPLVGSVEPDED